MKKTLFFASVALLAIVSCSKETKPTDIQSSDEISLAPIQRNDAQRVKGYSETAIFEETLWENLHKVAAEKPDATVRTMQISSYLYPQNGIEGNYFVDKTFAKKEGDSYWRNYNGENIDPIYWPVGGKLDFLAYSLSSQSSNVTVTWDQNNAASKVVLNVPAENSQNDILYSSASRVKAAKASGPVSLTFNHAQAWLEFVLTGKVEDIVRIKKIELEDAYNAGVLTISNNGGNAFAQWDFSGETAQNIPVDNFYKVEKLNSNKQYMDMLIPEQSKTAFVIYYVLGPDADINDPDDILSYRFTTDQKTWFAGQKYIYNINIETKEITVDPKVTEWVAPDKPAETTSIVKVEYDDEIGTVEVESLDEPATKATAIDSCSIWGGRVKLTAKVNDDKAGEYRFEKWSDGSTENPHIVTVTEDVTYKALFTDGGKIITINVNDSNCGKVTINDREVSSMKVAPGEKVTVKAFPEEGYKLVDWVNQTTLEKFYGETLDITVTDDVIYTAEFGFVFKGGVNNSTKGDLVVKVGETVISPSAGSIYTIIGASATVTATPKEGYAFSRWYDDSTLSAERTMQAANDKEIKAYFGYEITVQVRNGNYLEISFDKNTWTTDTSKVFESYQSIYVRARNGKGAKFYQWMNSDTKQKISADFAYTYKDGKNISITAIDVAEDAICGEFSVSPTKKVCFSPGNLQAKYSGSDYTWEFADYQYSIVGNGAGNTTIGSPSSGDVVDLFGWSASGNGNWGISIDTDDAVYSGTFENWGQKISVGDYDSPWRTLTNEEWNYLCNNREVSRSYSIITFTSSSKWVKGLLLYPDDYSKGYYTDGAQADIIPDGAVFLPYAGEREGNTVKEGVGNYWSSTNNGANSAYRLGLSSQVWLPSSTNRHYGHSVRLVSEIKGK